MIRFKSILKKSFFVFLWLLVIHCMFVFTFSSFELLLYEFTNKLYFLVGFPIHELPCSTTFFGILCFMLARIFNELELYLFSYHIYTGKYNWYKFFREREKQQKKQNSDDYKNLVKSLKEEKKNEL